MTFSVQCLIPQALALVLQFWPSLIAELMRGLENWDLCGTSSHSLSQGWSCCAPICSMWHFWIPSAAASCWLIWVAVLQHFSSSSKAGLGKHLDTLTCVQTFFCVNWSPFQTGDAHTDPSPCPSCSGDTIHFFSCLCSPSPNYLSPQDNLFLAHDSDSDSTVWLCFPVPVISNLHSADRRGKIIFWGVRGNLWN